jgi:hypothetical protein
MSREVLGNLDKAGLAMKFASGDICREIAAFTPTERGAFSIPRGIVPGIG